MKNMVKSLQRRAKSLAYPLIFVSSVLIIGGIINLISIDKFSEIAQSISGVAGGMMSFAAPAFVVYYSVKNSKKALASGFCVIAGDIILFSVCNVHFSLVFSLIAAVLCEYIYKRFDLLSGFYMLLAVFVLISVSICVSYDYLFEVLKSLCTFLKGKGALFGMTDYVYRILFSDNLGNLMLKKDYSGTLLTEDGIISGAINIFKSTKNSEYASEYLSGKYFINIFLPAGMIIALYKKTDGMQNFTLLLSLILSAVFGDARMIAFCVIAINPVLFIGSLFIVFISYFVSSMLNIGVGYESTSSVFELIKYGNKWVYFILTGIIITALTYYFSLILLSKFDFRQGKYFPKEIRRIVNALGGAENILKISGGVITVSNPNLIDIISLDCDIIGNKVRLLYDDCEVLKEYL